MNVREHLAGLSDQYVKTPVIPMVQPDLVQYLDRMYPDKVSTLDLAHMDPREAAFYAGQVAVVNHVRRLAEMRAEERAREISKTLEGKD